MRLLIRFAKYLRSLWLVSDACWKMFWRWFVWGWILIAVGAAVQMIPELNKPGFGIVVGGYVLVHAAIIGPWYVHIWNADIRGRR